MAVDADLRVDVPRYRVFRDGHLVEEPTDITGWWRPDLVAFLLGCSFTFEWALAAAGLIPAHQQRGGNVPMYITNRQCVPGGRLEGPMVVTLRPFSPADAERAAEISRRFPAMHGGPVHIGDPEALGIKAIDHPFPSDNETASLLATFAVFAAAFFMRPLPPSRSGYYPLIRRSASSHRWHC